MIELPIKHESNSSLHKQSHPWNIHLKHKIVDFFFRCVLNTYNQIDLSEMKLKPNCGKKSILNNVKYQKQNSYAYNKNKNQPRGLTYSTQKKVIDLQLGVVSLRVRKQIS